jgi:two-component system, NarL family, response regulator YdfI
VIRVLIAANSPVVRAGLEAVVGSSSPMEFIRSISLHELESGINEVTADVLLAEIPNLDEDWLGTLTEISIPAVILTDIADPAVIASSLRSGVRSLLTTDASAAEIAAAIQSAFAGLTAVQPSMLDLIVDPRPVPAKLEEPLSPRELEVLALMGEGLSNKLIAYRLGISEHTVKFHVTSIMGKLHAGSRTDAVMQGIRRGLLMI